MKTMKLLAKALPLCAVALLAGCSEAAVDDHPAITEGGGTCTYTATIDNGDTRTIVSEERNYLVLWAPGDAVSFFHCGENTNLKSNYKGTGHEPYGEFDIEGLAEIGAKEGAYHAGISPYAEDNTYIDGKAGLTLPAEQIYRPESYGGVNIFMTASAPAEEAYTLSYTTFHGSIAIQLRGTAPIGSIRFTSLPIDGTPDGPYGKFGGKLTGRVTVAEPYTGSEPTIEVGEVSADQRTVTLRCEEAVTLSEDKITQFCLALLPDTYKLKVEIFDIYNRPLLTKTTARIEIKRRLIKPMAELNGIMALPVPVPEPTDLSPEGKIANCYVITPAMGAGSYSFDASTMGNGEAGLQFTYATDLLPNGSAITGGATADLLWQDYYDTAKGEGLITEVNYDKDSQRITFATGSTYHVGNAVVALRDEAGKILWSWHLWFANPQPVGMTSIFARFADPLNMNLGATVNTPDDLTNSAGLLYQWGRKDPIIGVGPKANLEVEKKRHNKGLYEATSDKSKTLFTLSRETYDIEGKLIPTSTTAQTTIGKAGWSSYKSGGMTTITHSIQNPMTIIICTNSYSDYGWLYDGVKSTYMWGVNAYGTTTNATITKSIFDPCPYGYKVPDTEELTFTSKATRGDYGYIFKGSTGEIYIPAAGYRDGYNASYLGGLTLRQSTSYYNLVGGCWYARHHSVNNKQGYNINIRWHSSYPGNSSYNQCLTNAGYKKAYALPVRCVKTSNIE